MCFKKISKSNTIIIEPVPTITPSNVSQIDKLRELENLLNEVINQLNAFYDFKVKTIEETLANIYALVLFTAKKYDKK